MNIHAILWCCVLKLFVKWSKIKRNKTEKTGKISWITTNFLKKCLHWKALNCLCASFLNQRSNTYQCAVLSVCTLYWILPRYFFFFFPLLSLATVVGSTSSFFKSSSVSERFCKDLCTKSLHCWKYIHYSLDSREIS